MILTNIVDMKKIIKNIQRTEIICVCKEHRIMYSDGGTVNVKKIYVYS